MKDAAHATGLAGFGPATAGWFAAAFEAPTDAQRQAWAAINTGQDTLVVAPTGSGKTLAAFLVAIDRLTSAPAPTESPRCRVLYISPLKALGVDVSRNLRSPLTGIRAWAEHRNLNFTDIEVGVRSGDTPAQERRRLVRTPPDILITTPESLFLMLTSAARNALAGVETVIVDEVHALAGNKRGAHLAVSLERLTALTGARPQRIGLSATVRPTQEVARFLSGSADTKVVTSRTAKNLDLRIEVPVPDLTNPPPAPDSRDSAIAAGELEGLDLPEAPRQGIWPHVEKHLDEAIAEHRATLVFVNSRRVAERITGHLNELHPEDQPVARAHHGSVSKDLRLEIEDALKSGRLPAVVATSSLELGIDMGSIDLVAQVEAPPSVAAGLQRVGRAGHQVGATSRGVFYPKHRGDLLSSVVVAMRMARREIESLSVPAYPLDVLAQQIIAAVAMDDWHIDDLRALISRSAPFADLPDEVYRSVLDMLAGRYPSAEFAELRARLTWDRTTGLLTSRPGSQRLAVTSGGTIADRGLFGVYLEAGQDRGNRKVGELDEEMVYESRAGDVIALGATSWRIQEITADRVIVVPAPGQPGRLPFWHGDALGRPYELGKQIGAFVRTYDTAQTQQDLTQISLDGHARGNLEEYLAQQRAATGVLPTDRTVVVERFRDELGDWRLVVHSLFGARVNAAWAQVIGAGIAEQFGIDAQVMPGDDGIVARLPDIEDEGLVEQIHTVLFPRAEEAEQTLRERVADSALFASRFRECAGRALLLPRRSPTKRRPLWQQRQRAAQLLEVASQYPRFPITLEAARECLTEVYDVPALVEVLDAVESGQIRVVDCSTPTPSPFSRSLLFAYLAAFMYEGDSPLAERRAQALTLDPDLLAELLGDADLADLLDPDAVESTIADLQWRSQQRRPRDAEATLDMLRSLGPMSHDELAERGVSPDWLAMLVTERRVFRARVHDEERFCANEDAAVLRDGLGVALPVGLPDDLLEPVPQATRQLVVRYLRCHGPASVQQISDDLGLPGSQIRNQTEALVAAGRAGRGRYLPQSEDIQYCDLEVLRRLRRRSVARYQAATEPVPQRRLGQFLPKWQGVTNETGGHPSAARIRLLEVVEQLAGAPLPASALETDVLPSRVPGYRPELLDELTTSGEVIWWGAGSLPGNDGWVCLAPSGLGRMIRPAASAPAPPEDATAAALLALLSGAGAWFGADLLTQLRADGWTGAVAEFTEALWSLVWAGHLSNDSPTALRSYLAGTRAATTVKRRPGRGQLTGLGPLSADRLPAAASGRWSRVTWSAGDTEALATMAHALLYRHGVVTKGSMVAERFPGGFAAFYRIAAALQDSGQAGRLYVVDGLGGSQFCAPGAADEIRSDRQLCDPVVLSAADPANPYGASLAWPVVPDDAGGRPSRSAGARIVLVGGALRIYLARGGKSLTCFADPADPTEATELHSALRALADRAATGRWRVRIQRINGQDCADPSLAAFVAVLKDAGFHRIPQGWTLPRAAAKAGGPATQS